MALITWHGIGPWHKTGYGLMTDLFTALLRDLGHQVVIAVMGEQGDRHPFNHPDAAETRRTGLWNGMRVIGPGLTEFGLPPVQQMRAAHGGTDPDLIIVLKDAWVLSPLTYRQHPRVVVWLAFDCEPMGQPDLAFFRQAGRNIIPVCTSLWGQSQARKAGLDARYIPPGIDTGLWSPGSQDEARELLGLPSGQFIAGIDAANIGPRKGWGEQLSAFARHHARHPDSLLLIHAAPEHPEGINLRELAFALGLNGLPDRAMAGDRVQFGSQANMTQAQMLSWYRSLDVLMQGTYGEGYGLPIIQAQACGVPVIGTDCSAISEKIPPHAGWLVRGQRWWNPHHQAWWTIPDVQGLATALGKAAARRSQPGLIREHVQKYDAGLIAKDYWAPLIGELCD